MKLKITSKHPKNEVKDIVLLAEKEVFGEAAFRLPPEFKVWVKNCEFSHAGRFYGSKMSLRIGPASSFPVKYQYPRLKTAPSYVLNDWKEALFVLTVHEMWHYYQMRTNSGYSEIETENRSVKALERFRLIRDELESKWKDVPQVVTKSKIDPVAELKKINDRIAKFQRKLKLCQTKIKMYSRKKMYWEKKLENK
jgi:uncharacterized membrane protein